MARVATTIDPDGRRVTLTDRQWRHIKEEHADLSRHLREIMATVREPDRRLAGPKPGEEWFFAARSGPGPWLLVVVHYEGGEGWIATAHALQSPPRA